MIDHYIRLARITEQFQATTAVGPGGLVVRQYFAVMHPAVMVVFSLEIPSDMRKEHARIVHAPLLYFLQLALRKAKIRRLRM